MTVRLEWIGGRVVRPVVTAPSMGPFTVWWPPDASPARSAVVDLAPDEYRVLDRVPALPVPHPEGEPHGNQP